MISFTVNKIKYVFQFLQYFSAVITQKKTSCGFYWFSNTGKPSSSCVRLSWKRNILLCQRGRQSTWTFYPGYCREGEQICSWNTVRCRFLPARGDFPKACGWGGGTVLPTTGCCWMQWMNSLWAWGLSAGELISASRTEPGVSQTSTDALCAVKMFSVVLLSHKDKP